ncbi:MAG: glucose-1-phosphate adenylyltransferase [Eubacteriales bacterium]|nr:glucose-1-phosphate adenylyltransferase [Eubacteriales bacterium]
MKNKECVAMLLAGGQGSRLMPLTRSTAKPSVPFGALYRIIDFPLSNCINSGIDTVGVLTQYRPQDLNAYLGQGDPWDMDIKFGGLHVLTPYLTEHDATWFEGTADSIYQHMNFIKKYGAKYVLVLSGDHIYKMNYNIMLQEHKKNEADCTIAVIDVPIEEASRFGIMNTDSDGRIVEFEEKPTHPKSTQASMGVYIFNADKLYKYLAADARKTDSAHDFGKNIIPDMLGDGCRMFAHLYKGYWRDVGTLNSYWEANMDAIEMQGPDSEKLILDDPGWRIYFRHDFVYPQYIGTNGNVRKSIIGDGCEIDGTVDHSVLFSKVIVEKGAVVKDSILLSGAIIRRGAVLDHAIISDNTEIGDEAHIGTSDQDYENGKTRLSDGKILTVAADNINISGGQNVKAGSVVMQDI